MWYCRIVGTGGRFGVEVHFKGRYAEQVEGQWTWK